MKKKKKKKKKNNNNIYFVGVLIHIIQNNAS